MTVLNNTGNCFLVASKKDSAMAYYGKALRSAKIAQDSAGIMQNLGAAYLAINKPDIAKQYLLQALKLNPDSTSRGLVYLNLSRVYAEANMTDSAMHFAGLAAVVLKKQNNIHSLAANYKILSRLEEKNGNHKKALDYYKKYLNNHAQIQSESVFDIQGMETKRELEALRSRQLSHTGIIACFCFVSLVFVFVYTMHIRRKNRKWEQLNLTILKLKDMLAKTQLEMNEKMKFKNLYCNILREIYKDVEQLSSDNIFHKIVNRNKETENDVTQYLRTILYKNNTWEIIYNTEKSLFDKIKQLYPKLTEPEFKIVCLDCMDYTNTMIANITELKPNTVQQHKSSIRNKLNMEAAGDIGSFILKQITHVTQYTKL
jgi:tetratricopeptide (TPR) repeat protein